MKIIIALLISCIGCFAQITWMNTAGPNVFRAGGGPNVFRLGTTSGGGGAVTNYLDWEMQSDSTSGTTLADTSGNGNTGNLNPAAFWVSSGGPSGYPHYLNFVAANSDYVQSSSTVVYGTPVGSVITVKFNFYYAASGWANGEIFTSGNEPSGGVGTFNCQLYAGGSIYFACADGANNQLNPIGPGTITTGWHYMEVVYNFAVGNITVYADGTSLGSTGNFAGWTPCNPASNYIFLGANVAPALFLNAYMTRFVIQGGDTH